MGELEEKLNSILSSPAEMEKLMGIARSLAGSAGMSSSAAEAQKNNGSPTSTVSALGNIDPKMLGLMTRLATEYSSGKNDKEPLLDAMKPYLREERYGAIDRAAKIAKLAHIARAALNELGDGGK